MAASEFTLDSVKEFMLSHGGKVKNHELVTHFKVYLNDPERKGAPYYNFNLSKIGLDFYFFFVSDEVHRTTSVGIAQFCKFSPIIFQTNWLSLSIRPHPFYLVTSSF